MFLNASQILNGTTNECFGPHKSCHPEIQWGVIPIFNLTFMVVNIILNGVVLVHFMRYRGLRTPFSVYLINLLISNLAICFIQNPIKLIANVYLNWTILSATTCTLNLYGGIVVGGGIMTSHALITASRVWATTWPISYRDTHTKKVAILAVVAMWSYVHMLKLPQLILDGAYYRLPLSEGCILNHTQLSRLDQAGNILINISSFVFILVAYPFLWWKSRFIGTVGNSLALKSRTIRGANKSTAAQTEARTGKADDLPVQRKQICVEFALQTLRWKYDIVEFLTDILPKMEQKLTDQLLQYKLLC